MNGEKCECRKLVFLIGNKFMKLNILEFYKVMCVFNNYRFFVLGICLIEVVVYMFKMLYVILNLFLGVVMFFLVFLLGVVFRVLVVCL